MPSARPDIADPLRRRIVLAGAVLAVPVWAGAQTGKRARPMTAAEEAAAARAVAEYRADQAGEPVHPAIGLAPRLPGTVPLFDGREFSEAQVRGKLLLVFYWASWCPVCKVVEPRLNDFWLKNRARGVEVLALSTDNYTQPAFAHMQRTGFKYPAAMAASAHWDQAMAPRSLPTLLVRSRQGVIVDAEEGDINAGEFRDLLVHL